MAKLTRYVLFSWPAFFIAAGVLWMFSQSQTGAEMYGRFNPVVSPLQVTSVEPAIVAGAPGSKISGFATIRRDSCDYLDVEWTLHSDNRSVRSTAFFADKAQVREPGTHQWEALLVGVEPDKLQYSTGDVRHECGVFPVVSPFYRPDESAIIEQAGATALCASGMYSTSTGPGTCSGHGGVERWLVE